jgi:hypothetical protein
MTMTMSEQIEKAFTYYAPKGDQPERYRAIRDTGKDFAMLIDALCPDCREKSIAMTKIDAKPPYGSG